MFNNKHLDMGGFCKVFPVSVTLKLNEHHQIEILKKENNKKRVVKVDRPGIINSCAKNETLFGVNIPYLHMKPVIERVEPSKQEKTVNYIVMHKMPGATLDELLVNGIIDKLNKNRKIFLLLSLLEALQNLHQQGLVHEDIKPDNIMLSFIPESLKPQVNIIDFGFCKWEGDQDRKISGASAYIAPEAKDKKSCQSSDIFSLGKTFSDICKQGSINEPIMDSLIHEMTLTDYKERISLKGAITKVEKICSRQQYEKLVRIKLPLLLILNFNKSFASIFKKFSLLNQTLIALQQKAKNSTGIKDPQLNNFLELNKFQDLNGKLKLIEILEFFKNSYTSQLGETLINAFKLSLEIDNQLASNKLNDLRQSIVKAIFIYVQKTYKAHSNDRAGSQRRINNIQTLLTVLKDPLNEQALKNEIISWNNTIERGCLGNSKLYDLVANAAGLKRKNTIQSLFWGKSSNAYSTNQQRSVFDPLLYRT
ncbi:serine/threonine-protein kinase [Rickettsiella endosymbiont of Rhagonycha lignosa]|uniref:serine/threonine-protein kinase n=1 Tax=Rickettsiella endosymbiont of Rhagonycha lignosa TaxID=3077937 RepID=UPI00313B63B2